MGKDYLRSKFGYMLYESSLLLEIALTISIAIALHSLAENGLLGLQAIMVALEEVIQRQALASARVIHD